MPTLTTDADMFEKLLLALDDSPASEVATVFATAYARRYSSSVHVLHVNERQLAGRALTLLSGVEATALIGDAILQLRAAGVPASGSVHMAPYRQVAGCIAEEARSRGIDAIVLGSHRHRRLGRLFSARVRDRTARLTSLPILTAPAPLDVGARAHLSVDELVQADLGDLITLP